MAHGRKRLENIYYGMRTRCYKETHQAYHRYGGRGIKVCDEWNTFQSFRAWALSNGYNDTLTLDRIDNDGDYSPANCRWADTKTQNRNRSDNRWITFNGETRTLTEWTRSLGVAKSTIRERLRRGWPLNKALTIPATTKGYKVVIKTKRKPNHVRKIIVDGEERSVADTARHYKISYSALCHRLSRGQSPQDAVDSLIA